MKTVRNRLFPALALVVCCGVVAAFVSRAAAQDKQEDWEAAVAEVEVMNMHLELYGQLVELIQGMHEINDSPSASAVMAVMSVDDHLGPAERVKFLNDMLDETDDPTVRRAIRTKLIDAYKELGDSDEALEQIEALISAEDE